MSEEWPSGGRAFKLGVRMSRNEPCEDRKVKSGPDMEQKAAQAVRSTDLWARQKVSWTACVMQEGQQWEGKVAKELK